MNSGVGVGGNISVWIGCREYVGTHVNVDDRMVPLAAIATLAHGCESAYRVLAFEEALWEGG